MLIKLIGSGVIITAATCTGYVLAGRYSGRVRHIRLMQDGLRMLEGHILFTSTPLPEALKKTAKRLGKPVDRIFDISSELLDSRMGYTVEEAWSIALSSTRDLLCMNAEDIEIIANFTKTLGSTDKENQEKNFRLVEIQLNSQLKKAEENRDRNERMYKNLGFLLGATLIILLF